jgi:hypothetical protein
VTETDAKELTWNFRRRSLVVSESLLRIVHRAVELYDGDLEDFVIFLAVLCANVGAVVRDADLAASPPKGRVPVRYYRGVSRRAIAASTGLPRETVRRRIASFIERGVLLQQGAYVRVPQGLLEQTHHRQFAQALIQEFARASAQIERFPD